MIQDNQTNMVYLAHGLSHYVPVCRNLLEALHQEEIHTEFLPYTSLPAGPDCLHTLGPIRNLWPCRWYGTLD